jgi:hypothetical protein
MGIPFWRTTGSTTITNSLRGSSVGRTLASHLSPYKKDSKRYKHAFKTDITSRDGVIIKNESVDLLPTQSRDTKEAPLWLKSLNTPCRNMNKPGGCPYGAKCFYNHNYVWGAKLVDADMYMENLPAMESEEAKRKYIKDMASQYGTVGNVNLHSSKKKNGEWSCNVHFTSMKACKDFVDAMVADGNPYNARIMGITDYSAAVCEPVRTPKTLATITTTTQNAQSLQSAPPPPKESFKRDRKKAIVDENGWVTYEAPKKMSEKQQEVKPVDPFPALSPSKLRQETPSPLQETPSPVLETPLQERIKLEETRMARDGKRYTKPEFLDYFGSKLGTDEWDMAERTASRRRLVSYSDLYSDKSKPRFGSVSFAALLKTASEESSSESSSASEEATTTVVQLAAVDLASIFEPKDDDDDLSSLSDDDASSSSDEESRDDDDGDDLDEFVKYYVKLNRQH